MADNSLSACDPTTSWYGFTYPLSWSNNCEVAQVLSDIPFISVGILVFGISVLFLGLKRISLSAVWLFFSVLLAFVGAVLELGQTLADEMAMTTTFVATGSEPAIRVREVLFAFSIGFRFLFYWSYVAEPPLRARCAASTQRVQRFKFLTLERTLEPHNASWTRLGLPGKLLGIFLLVVIIIITALQIVWRVVPRFHQYSNVYAADVALELLVSFLLLLKLLLNTVTFGSPDSMLVHTFSECLAPISGLLVSFVLGVGDLLYFAFTESTVGRLLQAFEVYVIVLFVVVIALLRHRNTLLSTTSSQYKTLKDIAFTLPEPPRESTFRITPPLIETPRMSMVLGTATQNKASSREVLRRSARRSLNQVSSWVSSRVSRNRPHYEDEEVKLWNAERVKVDPPYTGNIDTELRSSIVSLTQEPKEWTGCVRDASANHMSITSALDAQSAIARSMKGSIHSDQTIHPYRADVPQRTIPLQARTSSVPISSVPPSISFGAKRVGRVEAPEASPVYGLGGIQSLASTSDSQTSLDELLRQQDQLDQSIEGLKLFSTRTSINSSSSNSVSNPEGAQLTRSHSTGQRTVCSDVSLSSFPVPPWLTSPVPSHPSPRWSSMKRIQGDRRVRLAAARPNPVQDTYALVPPKSLASLVDIPSSPHSDSIPHSPLEEENEYLPSKAGKSSLSDSGGMRFNVTSFIGGLATPGEPRQESRERSRWPTESEYSVGEIQTISSMEKLAPRKLLVPPGGLPASPAVTRLSPLARSARSSQGDVADEPAHVMQHRVDDQTYHSLTIPLSAQTPVMDDAEGGTSIPPTRPQPMRETGSHITVSVEGADRAQRTFVRPRPPPLALHSYDTPRVQVLADD